MAWVFYHTFKKAQLNGNGVDFDTDNIDVLLLKSTATPTIATDEFVNTAVASSGEVSGTNYARKDITSVAVPSASAGTITVTGNDAALSYAQSSSGFNNARYALMFKNTSSDATARLIAYNDFGSNKNNTSGSFQLEFSGGTDLFTFA
jgi:hypothetical protein